MGIWLRFNKSNPRKPLGFKWNLDTIKILRYTYGNNTIQTREQNWEKVRKECKRKWGHLQLSVIEKKTLTNQVMLSKIWYL